MENHQISKVQLIDSGELLLVLKDKGNPAYQYVYREARAVYWDSKLNGFKSSGAPKEWTYPQWLSHIITVVGEGIAVRLTVSEDTDYSALPEDIAIQFKS